VDSPKVFGGAKSKYCQTSMKKRLPVKIAVLTALATLSNANANTVSGRLWHVSEATSQNAIVANVPGTTADVTFDVDAPFNFSGTSATVGNWLGSSSAFNILENTPGTLASIMDNGAQGTLVDFKGFVSVTTGQTFTVTHDDGLTLIIGGLNLGFNPGPTAPTTTTATYSGPSGTFAFELVYGECCGGPAVLQIDLPLSNAVPEAGSSLAMLGGAFALILALGKGLTLAKDQA